MSNYFRITGYVKEKDLCFIMDCNGMFEKLWEFSAYLVEKGIEIVEANKECTFTDINLEKVEYDKKHIFLRVTQHGRPTINGNIVNVGDKKYQIY